MNNLRHGSYYVAILNPTARRCQEIIKHLLQGRRFTAFRKKHVRLYEGYGANDHIETDKPPMIVTGPGQRSGQAGSHPAILSKRD